MLFTWEKVVDLFGQFEQLLRVLLDGGLFA